VIAVIRNQRVAKRIEAGGNLLSAKIAAGLREVQNADER